MTASGEDYREALRRAAWHAQNWIDSLSGRPVAPRKWADDLAVVFGGPLPDLGCDAVDVVDLLAEGAEPGLMAMGSGRFFGWVIGGTLPAALAADWLVSAWDQNTGLRFATPATAAIEEVAGRWLLDLLGLPGDSDVGFTTGAMMANFTCLAAARGKVLNAAGWDVHGDGLAGAPRVHVMVGAERHDSVDLALRYLGLGKPLAVAADDQGRIRPDALGEALALVPEGAPLIVCLQAGNLHSGAFDSFTDAIRLAHEHGAWVHVDGAFGLWAAASPRLRHLTAGVAAADSWATDAHKTLNVPYDCGVAVVADPGALRSVFGAQASYLIVDDSGPGDPSAKVPEFSRRARGVPVWAALRCLGRQGVTKLVEHLTDTAQAMADGISGIDDARVVNDVVYTQLCVEFGTDERTREVTQRLLVDGTTWMSGSRWHGRDVMRVSVSNWSTVDQDILIAIDALRHAADGARR